jgi:lipoprotein signal peptidase
MPVGSGILGACIFGACFHLLTLKHIPQTFNWSRVPTGAINLSSGHAFGILDDQTIFLPLLQVQFSIIAVSGAHATIKDSAVYVQTSARG